MKATPTSETRSAEAPVRNTEIDGIRGWAALIVLWFHFVCETFGPLFPELHSPGLQVVLNGKLAVCVFFVLSGDALSLPYFRSGRPDAIVRAVASRYQRLTGPALVSCLLVWLLMRSGLAYNQQASQIVHGQEWLGMFLKFSPSFKEVLRFVFFGEYFDETIVGSYNPFLWTMRLELLGSILVFLNVFTFDVFKRPMIVLACQASYLALSRSYLCLFPFGVLIGAARSAGSLDRIRLMRWAGVASWTAITVTLTAMVLGATNPLFAPILVLSVYVSTSLLRFFRSVWSLYLGDVSFAMYLVQFPVLVSLTSYLIVQVNTSGVLTLRFALGIAAVSVAVTIAIALPFRWLENWWLRQLRSWSKNVLKPRT